MKINRIPASVLQGVAALLKPYCATVDEVVLVGALRAFDPDRATTAEKQPAPAPDKALRVREAAAMLGVSRTSVFALLRQNRLPRVKLGSRTVRVPEHAVRELLNQPITVN